MYSYKVSSRLFKTNFNVPSLRPYSADDLIRSSNLTHFINSSNTDYIFSGTGLIEDREYKVELCANSSGYSLKIHEIAQFFITSEGSSIFLVNSYIDTSSHTFLSAFTGPALILALALQDVFCIHASAVRIRDKLALFIAESGFGKSTIALNLDSYNPNISRISDDILPACRQDNILYALPHFPQLKLESSEQYQLHSEPSIKISHIYILDKKDNPREISLNSISSKQLSQNLIKQTLSTVLFDKDILRRHLAFCTGALGSFKAKRITFSHNTKAIPALCEAIIEDINGA